MIGINEKNFGINTFIAFIAITLLVFICFEIFDKDEIISDCDGYTWTRHDALRELKLSNDINDDIGDDGDIPREFTIQTPEQSLDFEEEQQINLRNLRASRKESAVNALISIDSAQDTEDLIEAATIEQVLLKSIKMGSMGIIEAIDKKYGLREYKDELHFRFNEDTNLYKPEVILLRWACMYGRKDATEWLIDTLALDENHMREGDCLTLVCSNGNIELFDYLCSKFKFTKGDIIFLEFRPIEAAIMRYINGTKSWTNSIIYKLLNNFNLERQDLFNENVNIFTLACYQGGDLIQEFYNRYAVKKDEATSENFAGFKALFNYPTRDYIKWFIETYKITNSEIYNFINYITSICKLQVFVYINSLLKLSKNDINIDLLQGIIREDNQEILEYIHTNICSLTNLGKDLSKYAIQNSSKKCSNYIIANIIRV